MYTGTLAGLGQGHPSAMRVDEYGYPDPAGELVPIEWIGGGIHPADPRCAQVLRRYAGFVPDPIDPSRQSARSYTFDEATGQWGSIAAGAIISCQAVAPLGSQLNPVPEGYDPVTAEELAEQMAQPGYEPPTFVSSELRDPAAEEAARANAEQVAAIENAQQAIDDAYSAGDAGALEAAQQQMQEALALPGSGPGSAEARAAAAAAGGAVAPLALAAGLGLLFFALPRRRR